MKGKAPLHASSLTFRYFVDSLKAGGANRPLFSYVFFRILFKGERPVPEFFKRFTVACRIQAGERVKEAPVLVATQGQQLLNTLRMKRTVFKL